MLPLIDKLFRSLESEGVIYCHWKSNAFMACAAQGEDDLDLLVSHSSQQVFLEILCRLGFKEGWVLKGRPQISGILHYYGYEETACRLVHIHVHYKLIIGHDMTKNYHLPIERIYLQSSFQGGYFRIPAPEYEFIVFVIRMILKHSTWNAMLNGQGNLSGREKEEMEYLWRKVSHEQISDILTKYLPFLKVGLFNKCIRSLQPACPFFVRFKAGQQLQRALRGCALCPRVIDILLQFWRRLAMAGKRKIFGYSFRKSMKNGGILVAFVGGDGSGKTTVVEGLSRWLSPHFITKKIHMGKPSWSWTTILIRGILKIGRILGFYPFTKTPCSFRDEANPVPFPGYPSLIRAVCTARDRYLFYIEARRQADKGLFVICDRFPLPQKIFMDGPQVEWMTRALPNKWFIRLLGNLEKKYYEFILPPDLLFVLKVNPETAVHRKSDEDSSSVWVRSREIWEKDWEGIQGYIIDAGQPKAEVLRRTKALLWSKI